MTQHVRKAYRRHRRGAWLGAIAVLAVAGLTVVLPAFGGPGDTIPPPSGAGVTPTEVAVGGTNFDCRASYVTDDHAGVAAPYSFKIANPTNGTFTDASTGVRFTISNIAANGNRKDKFFDFSVTGGAVQDVGVNGGDSTAHYAYTGGLVGSDTALHATAQSTTPLKLYSLSHLTFCYDTGAAISGVVFHDLDASGTRTDGSGGSANEPGQAGWTVRLYSAAGAVLGTRTTGADGRYSFTAPLGGTYTVCEQRPSSDSWGGSWGQTTPTTTQAACSGAQEPNGWRITGLSGNVARDFGNVQTTTIDCGGHASTTNYEVQLGGDANAEESNSNCDKADEQEYVIETWQTGSQFNYLFAPFPAPASSDEVLLVEKLTGSFAASLGQTAKLKYDDTPPYDAPVDMPYCKVDPRVSAGSLILVDNVVSSDVLPGTATSCLIEASQLVPSTAATPTLVDSEYYVFSSVDGYRLWP